MKGMIMTLNEDQDEFEKDLPDDSATEIHELTVERYELITRNGTGADRIKSSIHIKLSGVPATSGGVLRAGNIYFRRLDQGIEAPRFVPDVRQPYVSLFVWIDQFPMVLQQLSLPDRRLIFRRFSSGNVRAEIIGRSN
jgi:hypothetical protein